MRRPNEDDRTSKVPLAPPLEHAPEGGRIPRRRSFITIFEARRIQQTWARFKGAPTSSDFRARPFEWSSIICYSATLVLFIHLHVGTRTGTFWNESHWSDPSWAIMIHHEQSWSCLIDHDRAWSIMIVREPSWSIMSNHDRAWAINHDQSWSVKIH